jgi:hypothetical protein
MLHKFKSTIVRFCSLFLRIEFLLSHRRCALLAVSKRACVLRTTHARANRRVATARCVDCICLRAALTVTTTPSAPLATAAPQHPATHHHPLAILTHTHTTPRTKRTYINTTPTHVPTPRLYHNHAPHHQVARWIWRHSPVQASALRACDAIPPHRAMPCCARRGCN